jgi:hypothetical protein
MPMAMEFAMTGGTTRASGFTMNAGIARGVRISPFPMAHPAIRAHPVAQTQPENATALETPWMPSLFAGVIARRMQMAMEFAMWTVMGIPPIRVWEHTMRAAYAMDRAKSMNVGVRISRRVLAIVI